MSYSTIATCAHDQALRDRVAAACAAEGEANPESTAAFLIWTVAAAGDVEAAYASALAASNPDPGGDPAVVTDQMILSAVQAALAEPAP